MAKCSSYKQIDSFERDWIARFLALKLTRRKIAELLGRDVRTIYAEINRNSVGDEYLPGQAEQLKERRRREGRKKAAKMNRNETRSYVLEKLRLRWSPDQIAGRMKRE